jgi:hypothetical protein
MTDQYVKIENIGDTDWNDGQPGHPYTIPAGLEIIVPWHIMCMWLGDPEARDNGRDAARQEERSRLHLRYGVTSGVEGDDRSSWEEAMPKLVAKRINGEQLATVADDPTGLLTSAAAPILTEQDTSTKIAELERLLNELKGHTPTPAAVAQSELPPATTNDPTPNTTGQPPADTPTRGKAGARG